MKNNLTKCEQLLRYKVFKTFISIQPIIILPIFETKGPLS